MKFLKFFSEARTELLKVSWPTSITALTLTATVLGVSIFFALYVAGVDVLLTQGVKWVTTHSPKAGVGSTQTTTQTPALNVGDIQAVPTK